MSDMTEEMSVTLEKANVTTGLLQEALIKIADALKTAVAQFVEQFTNNLYLFTATTTHPKWHHLYKHAKKWRTRKKYRNMLWRETLAYVAANWTKE